MALRSRLSLFLSPCFACDFQGRQGNDTVIAPVQVASVRSSGSGAPLFPVPGQKTVKTSIVQFVTASPGSLHSVCLPFLELLIVSAV